ncbi:hypothetical protein WDW37_11085 [Bdellovibrionota bacterium FG-1]
MHGRPIAVGTEFRSWVRSIAVAAVLGAPVISALSAPAFAIGVGWGVSASAGLGFGATWRERLSDSTATVSVLGGTGFAHGVLEVPVGIDGGLKIKPGILGEYFRVTQLWDPINVRGMTVRGGGYLFGPGVEVTVGKYSFLAAYDLYGKLNNPNDDNKSDKEFNYSFPRGPRIIGAYAIMPRVELFFEFHWVTYFQRQVGEADLGFIEDLHQSSKSYAQTLQTFSVGSRIRVW